MKHLSDTRRIRIGLAQINTTVGDFAGNQRKILDTIATARSSGVDLLAFPELATCGYPPEDLLFKPLFISENLALVERIAGKTAGMTVVLGFVDSDKAIYNAAAVLHNGKHAATYHKILLPNYGVFDEDRYFQAGDRTPVYTLNGIKLGINICEDIWFEDGPATDQALDGAELIVNISASPYHAGKAGTRESMVIARATDNVAAVAFVNLVGGQDELVFDGNSIIVDAKGNCLAHGASFREDFIVADVDIESVDRARRQQPDRQPGIGRPHRHQGRHAERVTLEDITYSEDKPPLPERPPEPRDGLAEIYQALVLGTHDYVKKNGFGKVIIGLSGGLDSSLVATIAADALGKDNVIGLAMPSRYSSTGSVTDAEALAKNLGIQLMQIPIEPVYKVSMETLAGAFKGTEPGVAEENLQARIRGVLVMALSNKFNWLVLTTGNKSEMATGYATIYGDMAGGFAVIKDVPKTLAYELAAYRNTLGAAIPETVITKPPSAELRPDQKDTDSLPPYEVLDPILTAYVEDDKSIEQIVAAGNDEATVRRIARLVDLSEYKRRQAPPGIKITARAFGRDRRLPITNRFRKD